MESIGAPSTFTSTAARKLPEYTHVAAYTSPAVSFALRERTAMKGLFSCPDAPRRLSMANVPCGMPVRITSRSRAHAPLRFSTSYSAFGRRTAAACSPLISNGLPPSLRTRMLRASTSKSR